MNTPKPTAEEALMQAGSKLANLAFNLHQLEGITLDRRHCSSLKAAQMEWDRAIRAYIDSTRQPELSAVSPQMQDTFAVSPTLTDAGRLSPDVADHDARGDAPCKCGLMTVPAWAAGVHWYWQRHAREECTMELPNKRCWCGLLRSEHIHGHASDAAPEPPK